MRVKRWGWRGEGEEVRVERSLEGEGRPRTPAARLCLGAQAARNEALGIGNLWAHFVWAQHVYDVLRVPTHFSSALCANLARRYFDSIRQYRYQHEMDAQGFSLAKPAHVHIEREQATICMPYA